jgi:DNA-directed RNA polymerase specialized sigma24 family protein
VTEPPAVPVLPDGVDDTEYLEIRRLMRASVLHVWRGDYVIAGRDPGDVVDEAWASMAEKGFRSAGPFLPFALRVARNKAIDARNRAEARRRDRSLQEPIAGEDSGLHLEDVTAGAAGADDDYFARMENVEEVRTVALIEEAIDRVLSATERSVFLAVQRDGKSRAAVGRDLDEPVTGQRIGQIVAAATSKIRMYVAEQQGKALV